ncbi:MAG: serine/threonine protein kinase [Deltaproteobacteria bacterium]|nr:MAG: serine/threonine protein kinase [Deltaproteobacteria bacterium]
MEAVGDQSEVSGRMVLSLLAFLRERGLRRRDLLCELDLEHLLDLQESEWVSYDDYLRIMACAEKHVCVEEWEDAGKRIFEALWLRRLRSVIGWTIPSVEGAYDWMFSFTYGPSSSGFRPLTFAMVRQWPGALRIVLRAPRGKLLPAGLVHITAGALETVPSVLGSRSARVVLTHEGDRAQFDVFFQERLAWTTLRRWTLALWPSAAQAAREREAFDQAMERAEEERRKQAIERRKDGPHAHPRREDLPEELSERYEVVGRLGQGALGEVLLAIHGKHRQRVAIKLLDPRRDTSRTGDELIRAFHREAEALRAVDSRYVVQLIEAEIYGPTPYLVLEYVEGAVLQNLLLSEITPDRAELLFRQVCRGLADLHGVGITHRDLSPSNILVERDTGQVKLIDFGFAKFLGEMDDASLSGRVLGTPYFLAPEALTGSADHRADLYAAGMLFYRMLAGRYPYDARQSADILAAQLEETPRAPSWLAPHRQVPPHLERVVMRCLEKDPNRRYASAQEVLADLDRVDRVPGSLWLPILALAMAAAILLLGLR